MIMGERLKNSREKFVLTVEGGSFGSRCGVWTDAGDSGLRTAASS